MGISVVKLPRVNLGHWPTPLHELPCLSATLGGPRIFVKREDMTGLALSGNKFRKLEYVLADALDSRNFFRISVVNFVNFCEQFEAKMVERETGLEPATTCLEVLFNCEAAFAEILIS